MTNLTYYCPKCGEKLILNPSKNESRCLKCDYHLNGYLNVIDIGYKSKGIAKALSNLCPYPFDFKGLYCSCMEAFLQSLKIEDSSVQSDLCSKPAVFCYSIRELWDDWRINQTLYFKGKPINRHSQEYINLIKYAYTSLYSQSPIFRYALNESIGYTLIHSIGCQDNTQTILTEDEYIRCLNDLRKK